MQQTNFAMLNVSAKTICTREPGVGPRTQVPGPRSRGKARQSQSMVTRVSSKARRSSQEHPRDPQGPNDDLEARQAEDEL